jgi:hypothetical protein
VLSPASEIVDDFAGTLEELFEEIGTLSQLDRASGRPEWDRQLLRLRHIAGGRIVTTGGADPAFTPADFSGLPVGDPLPELSPAQLSPGVLRAGILRDGCLLVRGLLDPDEAARLSEDVERAFDHRDGCYEPFHALRQFALTAIERAMIADCCGVPIVDAPVAASDVLEVFEAAGVSRLVRDYLGERPVISAQKTTLRKVEPSAGSDATAWHQDACAFGCEVHAVNMWIALTRCGDEAPGLDIIPRPVDHLVEPAGGENFPGVVSRAKAAEVAGDTPILRPIFQPGDALFFDELFLHSTARDPAMRRARFAIESWFFGASAFPSDYTPLVV